MTNPAADADYPIIGWQNLVTASNVAATSATPGYPASNLANSSTANYWLADDSNSPPSTIQYLTVSGLSSTFNYMGIARHNLSSSHSTVSVEVYNGGSWVAVTTPSVPLSDEPLFFYFLTQSYTQARLKIVPGNAEASVAVLYLGLALVVQRRIYADHVALPHARVVSGPPVYSEGGSYLGRIVVSEMRQTKISFKNLDPAWSRSNFVPFLAAAVDRPFFFSWRPKSYPAEVGFAALTNDPMLVPESPANFMSVELDVKGVI